MPAGVLLLSSQPVCPCSISGPLAPQCEFKQVFGNMFFCVTSGQAHVCDQVGGRFKGSGLGSKARRPHSCAYDVP